MKKAQGRGRTAIATQTGISTTQKILIGSAMFFGAAAVAAAGFAGTPEKAPQKKYYNGAGAAAAQQNGAGGKYDYVLAPKANHVYRLGDVNGSVYYFAKNNKFYQIVGYYDAWKNTVVDAGEVVTLKQFEAAKGEAGYVRPRPGSAVLAFKNTPQFPGLYVSEPGGILREVTKSWAKQNFGADLVNKIITIDNFEYGKAGSMWVDGFGFTLGGPVAMPMGTSTGYVPSAVMDYTDSIAIDLGL